MTEDIKTSFISLKRYLLKSPALPALLNELKENIVRVSAEKILQTYNMNPKEFLERKKLAWYPYNLVNALSGKVNISRMEIWVLLSILDDQGYITASFSETEHGFIVIIEDKLFKEYEHLL